MTNKTKTTNERQASFRQQKKEQGYKELSVWVKESTFKKITENAGKKGITKGELIDSILG